MPPLNFGRIAIVARGLRASLAAVNNRKYIIDNPVNDFDLKEFTKSQEKKSQKFPASAEYFQNPKRSRFLTNDEMPADVFSSDTFDSLNSFLSMDESFFHPSKNPKRSRFIEKEFHPIGAEQAEQFVDGVAGVMFGLAQYSANSYLRTAVNRSVFSIVKGGVNGFLKEVKNDPKFLARGGYIRLPYSLIALSANRIVANMVVGNQAPSALTYLEKIQAISAGAVAEFVSGSVIEIFTVMRELKSAKYEKYLRKNPGSALALPKEIFDSIMPKFTQKEIGNFVKKNSLALEELGIKCQNLSSEELLEILNKRENLAKMFEKKLINALLTKPESQKFIESFYPQVKIPLKDYIRAISASSLPHTIRNCAFLAPYYFSYKNNSEDDVVLLLTIAGALGAVMTVPHNIGLSASINVVNGRDAVDSLKKAAVDTLKYAKTDPKQLLIATMCRSVANMAGVLIFNKVTTQYGRDATKDILRRAYVTDAIELEMQKKCGLEVDILSPAHKEAVDEACSKSPVINLENIDKIIEEMRKMLECRDGLDDFKKIFPKRKTSDGLDNRGFAASQEMTQETIKFPSRKNSVDEKPSSTARNITAEQKYVSPQKEARVA